MSDTVDYTFKNYRRSYLFLKRPFGVEIPKGWRWKCSCGKENELTDQLEQYCPTCGTRLRIQEHRNEGGREMPQGETSFTVIKVAHFTIRNGTTG